jgi:ABC-type antimicrobial peptide transport system permease subunit
LLPARHAGESEAAGIVHALPGFLETAGIEVVAGRTLESADVDGAVVSESAARALFGGSDPIGAAFEGMDGRTFTVVGIVGDARMSLEQDPLPPVWVLPGAETRSMTVMVRTRAAGGSAALASLQRHVSAAAPGTLVGVRWWNDAISELTPYRNPRFQTVVLGAFALLALAVTALGIVGVIAFTMALRRREMGIRLALGGAPRGLVGLMMRYALAPVAVGLAAGLVATRALARLAEAQLFEVETSDSATLAATAFTVLLSAAVAAWVPARRAAGLDPISTLRPD